MIWLVLLLALIVFFLGFVVKALFVVAAILLLLWAVGWFVRPTGGRWYYW